MGRQLSVAGANCYLAMLARQEKLCHGDRGSCLLQEQIVTWPCWQGRKNSAMETEAVVCCRSRLLLGHAGKAGKTLPWRQRQLFVAGADCYLAMLARQEKLCHGDRGSCLLQEQIVTWPCWQGRKTLLCHGDRLSSKI